MKSASIRKQGGPVSSSAKIGLFELSKAAHRIGGQRKEQSVKFSDEFEEGEVVDGDEYCRVRDCFHRFFCGAECTRTSLCCLT